ncbi:TIGR03915 family putative DNA repair protein [Atopobiaceae bacterium 24-176]
MPPEVIDGLSRLGAQGPLCLSCEPSAEGVLTAVGATYLARLRPDAVRLQAQGPGQARLGEAVVAVETQPALAQRVLDGFLSATAPLASGRSMPRYVRSPRHLVSLVASMVDEPDMAEALHRYVRGGFSWGARVGSHNSDPAIARAEELATAASAECEHARQFIRFSRISTGEYLAVFRPKADVVPLVAGHFRRRMGTERFCIVDPSHGSAVLYAENRLALVKLDRRASQEACAQLESLHREEAYIRALWKGFYDAVSLPGRGKEQRGYDLRLKFMPKRLWQGLPELDPSVDTAWTFVPQAYRTRGGPQKEDLLQAGRPSSQPLLESPEP